jgi:hypothetical protein
MLEEKRSDLPSRARKLEKELKDIGASLFQT